MGFSIDKQTLDDLNIFGSPQTRSIFGLFDQTLTRGGALQLREMFSTPLIGHQLINKRSQLIGFFIGRPFFPFDAEIFDIADGYLANIDPRTKLEPGAGSIKSRLEDMVFGDTNQRFVQTGVKAMIELLEGLRLFLESFDSIGDSPLKDELLEISALFDILLAGPVDFSRGNTGLSRNELAMYDQYLRFERADALKGILTQIYMIDVYISVAKIAKKNNFCFAHALGPGSGNMLKLEHVRHPLLSEAVGNNFKLSDKANTTFLTGANMAGKSTFMKSLGISVFLAHLGFPIAAKSMSFEPFDGLYSTINLPDNVSIGASHFYAEVLRVKKIAKELSSSKRIFVLMDELFRGTNVKDAQEATVLLTQAFAKKNASMFVISTHIVEAGKILEEGCGNIRFLYLPTIMENKQPRYTYKVEEGITDDRQGMVIIENEGILEILKNGTKNFSDEI